MDTDLDLSQLIRSNDHLNVLRYVRIHQLSEPALVVKHGKALLGPDLCKGKSSMDRVVRLAAVEQICLAALECADTKFAEVCLTRLREAGIEKDSTRFRLLLARCLEASADANGAALIYDDLIKENPANNIALKRIYCLLKADPEKQVEASEALNAYLQQNYSDTAAWYELAQLKRELGDWKGVCFSLEEVLLAAPASSKIHCELAEAYATVGSAGGSSSSEGLENMRTARKHMAQALELEPGNVRAQFGLVVVANAYLEISAEASTKNADEFEIEVAQELVKYGVERVLASYKGSAMMQSVKALMEEYKDGLN